MKSAVGLDKLKKPPLLTKGSDWRVNYTQFNKNHSAEQFLIITEPPTTSVIQMY